MTTTARGVFVVGLLVLLTSALTAQQSARDGGTAKSRVGTAGLSGIVLNDVTNQPLRRAVITISESDTGVRLMSVTDETGTFSFSNLPDGRFLLSATKQGFVTMSFGAKKTQRPGTPIALAAGEHRTDIALRLPPGAVLSGIVRNRAGEPVADARVQVLRQIMGFDTGERTLSSATPGFGVATDDRGMYRVFGLPADDYLVLATNGVGISRGENVMREITAAEVDWATRSLQSATGLTPPPAPGQAVDYAPVFHPGVTTSGAATIVSVKAGEERDGVDILLDRMPMARVTGTVVSPTGDLPGSLQVNVIAHETIPGVPFSGFGSARVEADGHFATGGLAPGDYTLTVRASATAGRGGRGAPPSAVSALFGLAVVTVNGVDLEKTITLETGVTVEGRVVFDGTTLKPPADLTRVRVSLTPARSKLPTLGVPSATADANGAFTFRGVTPGRYRLTATSETGWAARTAVIDGHDSLDDPVEIGSNDIRGAEIRFTDTPTEISGDLLDASGHPAPEYFIILFPTDKSYWVPQSRRIQSARPTSAGKFSFKNLPAGEYFITAVTDVEQGQWFDPAFLAELVGASAKITLADGEKKTQSLRIK